jgi:hypothetical protein
VGAIASRNDLKREIPPEYLARLERRSRTLNANEGRAGLSLRGFWVGVFLSSYLAVGAPYVRMAMRASVMAFDYNTPGAIFLFLVLVGLLNTLFKVAARSRSLSLLLAAVAVGAFLVAYWPLADLDIRSPALFLNVFLVASALINLPVVWSGRSLALNRSELVLVYVMLLVVSALCTMGMSQQLLPALTTFLYYASPQNRWVEKLLPHFPKHHLLVDDGNENQSFFEGVGHGADIPYAAWIEPLIWWAIFLLALYVVMISIAVILRRQWMERERLAYPLTQVGVALVAGEDENRLVNGLLRQRTLWCGAAVPLFFGSLQALHRYYPSVPAITLDWTVRFFGQGLDLDIRFAMIGFSYLISTQVAAGLWIFHLLSKIECALLYMTGMQPEQSFIYSVRDHTLLAYQGGGALMAMVLLGLWTGRDHLRNVFAKAFGRAPQVEDSDEIMSYRGAVAGLMGGSAVMVGWLWLMGTKLWVAGLFICVALIVFIGVSRVVAESGLAAVRAPLIAPDLIVQGLGSQLVGASGVLNLSLAYIWCADIRIFLMAVVANGLKLIEEMDQKSKRYVFWAIILAIAIGAVGSCWMVLQMVYQHGGTNLDPWRFKNGPKSVFDMAVRTMEPTPVYWKGLEFFAVGGTVMFLLTFLRQRLLWWPLHPLGFPIGANLLMNRIWFSVFIAWGIKTMMLRYGGPVVYRRSQAFFLGLIMGETLCNGLWVVVDYFTGMVGNPIFGIT